MKILHCAPLDIEISPRLKYAGTERILLYLNRGLNQAGYISVVAGPGNSDLGGFGTLIPTRENPLWVASGENRTVVRSDEAYEQHYQICLNFAEENKFKVIHDHPGQFLFTSEVYQRRKRDYSIPIVTTIHGPTGPQCEEVSMSDGGHLIKYNILRKLQGENLPLYIVTVSKSHKKEHEKIGIRVDEVVYNGIDLSLFPFKNTKQNYMLWLGRLSGIKGTDLAVQVARRTKRPLIIAGEVHEPYRELFETRIRPYITNSIVGPDAERNRESLLEKMAGGEEVVEEEEIMFIGPVEDKQKAILYGNASVTLQPNRWKEPFGLVPVESMATGTPVIVTNRGALPELVVDGKTGFIVNAGNNETVEDGLIIEETINALNKLPRIKPEDCRNHIYSNFSMDRMTQGYISFYRKVA